MKKISIVFFILACMPAAAQKQVQQLIDSLIGEIPIAKDDTVRARLYHQLASRYVTINPGQSRFYADKGLLLAQRMKWAKGMAVLTADIATLFSDAGQYDSALLYTSQALDIHKKNRDSFNVASLINNMGVVMQRQSRYVEASDYFFQSLQVAEQIKNPHLIALAFDNISSVYIAQTNYPKALDYAFKALRIREQQHDLDGAAQASSSVAIVYMQLNDSVRAGQYFQKALTLYQQTGNRAGMATVYGSMATASKKNYKKNLAYAFTSREIWDEINPTHTTAIVNTGNIGVTYIDIAKDFPGGYPDPDKYIPGTGKEMLQRAIQYLQQAIRLSRETGDVNNAAFFTGNLAEAQALQGDYKNAYINFRRYQEVQDSIYTQESKNKIASIEAQREVIIRDKEIAFNKAALATQQKLRWALVAGIALLLVIAALLYYQNRIRKKNNTALLALNSQLDEANKIKAKFFSILSHDLRSPVANLISFLQLQQRKPGLLSEEQVKDREIKISSSAQALLETMEGMLLWSKRQMEHFKPVMQDVTVEELFHYLQNFFATITHVQFSFLEKQERLTVHTDGNYLKTILHNLTSNAIKAVKGIDQPKIDWTAWTEGNMLHLAIVDNGPGMTKEQIAGFYTTLSGDDSRYGLGLYIIRDLAAAINCTITVPAVTNGTRIELVLPVK